MGNISEHLDRWQEINKELKRAILQLLQQLRHEHHALVRMFNTALEHMSNLMMTNKVVVRANKRVGNTPFI